MKNSLKAIMAVAVSLVLLLGAVSCDVTASSGSNGTTGGTTGDATGGSGSATVSVQSVSLNNSNLTLNVGEQVVLIATVMPANATDKNVIWTSSNINIVTVDDGKLTAKAKGTAKITVTTKDGGKTAVCNVTVQDANQGGTDDIPIKELWIEEPGFIEITGQPYQLHVYILPENATDKSVTWVSSDESVAIVDSDGMVYPNNEGMVTITVTTKDGRFTSSTDIKIIQPRILVQVLFTNPNGEGWKKFDVYKGDNAPIPDDFTMTGHTFIGWAVKNGATGELEIVNLEEYVINEDYTTFYAVCDANSVTVIFDANDGSWSDGDTVKNVTGKYTERLLEPAKPNREGYTFEGWDETVSWSFPDENKTYTAQWKKKTIELTFYANSGKFDGSSSSKKLSGEYDSEITDVPIPTRTGYKFMGWDKDVPSKYPAENVTYTALWELKDITYIFDANGGLWSDGDTVKIITAKYGSIYAPEKPTREGYKFEGWSETVPGSLPDEDKTYTAQWKAKTIELTFYANSGKFDGSSSSKKLSGEYDSEITDVPIPTRSGYTFAGWDKDVPSKYPAENVTYTAQWDENKAGITVTLPEKDSDISSTFAINGTIVSFTVAGGTTFVWRVDRTIQSESSRTFDIDTATLSAGIHNVMVIVDGMYSATFILEKLN